MIASIEKELTAYQQYAKLLVQLHGLMKAGIDETPEGDALRDQMDTPWYQMSSGEQKRIRGLSADLYTIESDSPIVHPKIVARNQGFSSEMAHFHESGDFDGLLTLLRDKPHCIDAAQAAFERGLAYGNLGQHDVAIMFFDEALQLRPGQPWTRACRLDQLSQAGRYEEASSAAEGIASSSADPTELFVAGEFQFFQPASQPADARKKTLFSCNCYFEAEPRHAFP